MATFASERDALSIKSRNYPNPPWGTGRQRSVGAEARMRPTERHTKNTAGTTAQATAATQVAGRAPKRRCGGCRGAAVRLEPQSPYGRR